MIALSQPSTKKALSWHVSSGFKPFQNKSYCPDSRRIRCSTGGTGKPGVDLIDRPPSRLPWSGRVLGQQSLVMFSAGAILGPLLDNQHSRYHVLKYADPVTVQLPFLSYNLETCWWVPLLFGVAGLILGVIYPFLDALLDELLALLTGLATAQWAVFDRSRQGLLMSSMTAMCGPLIEIVLINQLHLYQYHQTHFWGIPNWIFAVYFCGGPAVGNLGRAVHRRLPAGG